MDVDVAGLCCHLSLRLFRDIDADQFTPRFEQARGHRAPTWPSPTATPLNRVAGMMQYGVLVE